VLQGMNNSSGQHLININEATVEQLELLTGIGRAKAEAIVEDRKVLY
jgi:DNA uptake protein ComE-like DNA-binding protein